MMNLYLRSASRVDILGPVLLEHTGGSVKINTEYISLLDHFVILLMDKGMLSLDWVRNELVII